MGYFWQPRWVRKKFNESGIKIETCVDEITNLIVCPLCINIDDLCPIGKSTSKAVEGVTLFFSIKDLIHHIYSHLEETWKERIAHEPEEEEG